MNRESHPYPGFPFSVGYQVPGSRYRVLVPGTGYPAPDRRRRPDTEHRGPSRVPGTRYRVPATWDLVPGTWAGPTPRAEQRAPKTEPAYWKTRTPGMQDAGCEPRVRVFRRQVPGARYRVPGIGCRLPGTWYPAPEPVRRRRPDTEPGTRHPVPGTCFYIW